MNSWLIFTKTGNAAVNKLYHLTVKQAVYTLYINRLSTPNKFINTRKGRSSPEVC